MKRVAVVSILAGGMLVLAFGLLRVFTPTAKGYQMDTGQGIAAGQEAENRAFFEKFPESAPFVKSLERTIRLMKAKQAKGFKAVGVTRESQGRHDETPARIVLYVQGRRFRLEMERGSERYTVINDGKSQVTLRDKQPPVSVPANRSALSAERLALAPWYNDAIKWTSFEFAVGEDGKAVGVLEGVSPVEIVRVRFPRDNPDKVAGLSTYTADRTVKNEQAISEYVQIDGLWLEKKLVSEHYTKQGKFVRRVTMESYDFGWRPDETTFVVPTTTRPATGPSGK